MNIVLSYIIYNDSLDVLTTKKKKYIILLWTIFAETCESRNTQLDAGASCITYAINCTIRYSRIVLVCFSKNRVKTIL